jgi:hypothetical protein
VLLLFLLKSSVISLKREMRVELSLRLACGSNRVTTKYEYTKMYDDNLILIQIFYGRYDSNLKTFKVMTSI